MNFAKNFKTSPFVENLQVNALHEYTGSIVKYLYEVKIIYYVAEAVAWMCPLKSLF